MRKFVLVGTGSRSGMYLEALAGDFKDVGCIAALCDTNFTRMYYWVELLSQKYGLPTLPVYHASEFDRMIAEIKPDTVIVTSMDRTHHKYICRAMELGCDVITEKPMTTDAVKCQQIIDTVKTTNKHLTVAFNYRYSPRNTKIKELLKSGIAGNITSVHFEWLLNTSHGADYFRRWHRDKNNSGGLLVHKSTHHFDLMNWWLDSAPETVFAMGSLRFYGKENAENRGVTEF
ncbi:MAG: Gfo/Idh/MocA family oxidoreductase, partial [Lentisphaeria bacterium]|nr:Gfo/Idh/MocA family oxidoreductase [Lentisphaeria bacterium]